LSYSWAEVEFKTSKVDQALFRLSGQVFFLSDVLSVQNSLNTLKCLEKKSYLSIYLDRSIDDLLKVKIPEDTLGFKSFSPSNLLPYIELEKLKISSLGRGKDQLQVQELLGLGKRCAKVIWNTLQTGEKALFLTEVYLRDRFKKNENLGGSLMELKNGLNVKEDHEVLSFKMSPRLKEKFNKVMTEGMTKDVQQSVKPDENN
jgi:hypothetical protein